MLPTLPDIIALHDGDLPVAASSVFDLLHKPKLTNQQLLQHSLCDRYTYILCDSLFSPPLILVDLI